MSQERLGYLVLGIVLAAAVVYGFLSLHQESSSTAPMSLRTTETDKGEASSLESDLDTILRSLPTTEQNAFDPDTIDWVGYTDGQDRFSVPRPRGWEIADASLPERPQFRRIVLSEGIAAFAVYPNGEFDIGLPLRDPSVSTRLISGQLAMMREWSLPDGSWFAVVTLDAEPKNGFRIELSTLQPNPIARAILKEMLKRFTFLE